MDRVLTLASLRSGMHGDDATEMGEYCSSASAEEMVGGNANPAMMDGEFDHGSMMDGSMMDGDYEGMMGF